MTTYEVLTIERDEGSVVVFNARAIPANAESWGTDEWQSWGNSPSNLIAVDHRMAQAIVADMEAGDGPVYIEAEGWQVVGTVR